MRAAPLAVSYGGGGLFGIAYLLGVGEALVDGVPRLPLDDRPHTVDAEKIKDIQSVRTVVGGPISHQA